MNENGKYLGKYRGIVVNNIDPLQMGRIQVIVPDVSNVIPTTWAMPCLPVTGIQMGAYFVPPVGAGVWVEFEQGDPDYPIWVGGFWGTAAEVPPLALAPPPIPPGQNIVLQTTGQSTFILSDAVPSPTTGGIILKSPTGAMVVVNDTGIYISNGKGATITIVGPSVNINNGALTII